MARMVSCWYSGNDFSLNLKTPVLISNEAGFPFLPRFHLSKEDKKLAFLGLVHNNNSNFPVCILKRSCLQIIPVG